MEELRFELVNYEGMYETGLNVTENPGATGIWFGIILITFGVLAAFYIMHKRIWVVIETTEKSRTKVVFGGVVNKNQLDFEKEIKEITKLVRK